MKVMNVTKVMKVRMLGMRSIAAVTRAATRILTFVTYITFITFITASAAVAAEADKPFAAPQAAERVATPGAGSLLQVTLSLALVLGAVFATAWLVRRLKTFGKFGSGPIEILADISIGAKERAVLVQIGGKQLLLGVAPGRVNTLHVLDEPISGDRLRATGYSQNADLVGGGSPDRAQRPDFKSIFKRSLGL